MISSQNQSDEALQANREGISFHHASAVNYGANGKAEYHKHEHYHPHEPVKLALPSIWGLPPKNTDFFARELATVIADKISAHKKSSISHYILIVLSGLGGVGKTELAKNYLYNHQETYTACLWFNANTRQQLELEYRALARHLNLGIDQETSNETVKNKLHTFWAEHPGWLIVVDNADDRDAIYSLLPPEGGDILITSRQPHWPGKIITIDVLEETETIAFYKKISSRENEDEEGIKVLVKKLGYLPLAIAQVATYVKRLPSVDAKEYLILFNEHRTEILRTNKLPAATEEEKVRLTIATTWNLSLDAIEQKYTATDEARSYPRTLLTACAYLNSHNIPIALLQEYLGATYKRIPSVLILNEAIDKLNSYSLIQADRETISIHSLVQTVIGMQATEKQSKECIKKFIICLNKLFDYQKYSIHLHEWKNTRKMKPFYDKLISHIYEISNKKHYETGNHQEAHSLLLKLTQYLIDVKADYRTAKVLIERLEQIHNKVINQDSQAKAELIREKASLSMQLGNYAQASKEFEEALELHKKNISENTEKYFAAIIYYQLGNVFYFLGQYNKAEENYKHIFAIYQTTDKDEQASPAIAVAWCGIANIRFARHEYHQAEIAYRKGLEIYTTVLEKKEHREIANIYCSLAQIFHERKEYNTALSYYEMAQDIYQKVYANEQHIDAAICFYDLSHLLYSLKKDKEALEKVRIALQIYTKIYGQAGHIDMVIIVFYLGFLMCRQNQYENGLIKYQRALTIYDTLSKNEKEENAFFHLRRYADNYCVKKEFVKAEKCYLLLLQYRYAALKQKGTRIVQLNMEDGKDNYDGVYQSSSTQDAFHLKLIEACNQGDLRSVMHLSVQVSNINQSNIEGVTPLFAAAEKGHLDIVKNLVAIGEAKVASVKKMNQEIKNPLLIASQHDHFQVVDYLLDFNIKIDEKDKKINARIWESKFNYRLVYQMGAMRPERINEIIGNIVEHFFSDDAEISKQATEILLSFDERLLSGLYYLHNKSEGKVLRKNALEEIIFTLCTIDADAIFFLLKNILRYDYGSNKEKAIHFLKAIGLKNDYLELFMKKEFLGREVPEFIDNTMKQWFIFDSKNIQAMITILKEPEKSHKKSNTLSFYEKFEKSFLIDDLLGSAEADEQHIVKSSKSLSILNEFKKVIEQIFILALQKNIGQNEIKILLKYLTHDYALIRLVVKNAILKLELLDTKKVQDALINTFSNENWRIRREGIELLSKSNNLTQKAMTCINLSLLDKMPPVRQAGATALIKRDRINEKVWFSQN